MKPWMFPETYEQVKRSPEYKHRISPERQASLPRDYPGKRLGVLASWLFAGLFVLSLVFFSLPAISWDRDLVSFMVWLPPAVCTVAFVFMRFVGMRMARAYRRAPVLARAVVIIDKRILNKQYQWYCMTVQFDDSTREEFVIEPKSYGTVVVGDAGVLFSKTIGRGSLVDSLALSFDRVAISQ